MFKLLLSLLSIPMLCIGQESNIIYESNPSDSTIIDLPQFPGGESMFWEYLNNTPYPPIAYRKGVEGVIFIQFIIEKDGNVTYMAVLNPHLELDRARRALEIAAFKRIMKMPKWSPARLKSTGEPVRVIFKVKITFKLT